jgi:hypothetical protein
MTFIGRSMHAICVTPPKRSKWPVLSFVALFAVLSGCGRKDVPLLEVRNDDLTKPLVLHVSFGTGAAASYPTRVLVVKPDGSSELFSDLRGTLKDGTLTVARPQAGTYRVYEARIVGLKADRDHAHEGEVIRFTLKTIHFPEGKSVEFFVCREGNPCGPDEHTAVARGQATLHSDLAIFDWAYSQPVGDDPRGSFMAYAFMGDGWEDRDGVKIEAFSLDDVRGVRQLMKAGGYYQGSVFEKDERPFKAALSRFQSENSPCMYGVATRTNFLGCHVITCGVGGLEKTPPEELGLIGSVTRKMLYCVASDKAWPMPPDYLSGYPAP